MDMSCNSCLEYQIAIQNMKDYIRYYEDKIYKFEPQKRQDFKTKREYLLKTLQSYEALFERECCLK
jgi:hypothetical protein